MGKDEDFLFPILVKKGAAISYEAARDQFRKGLKAAGIENIEKFGLHSMRRGSVTAPTQAGVSDYLVQKHLRVVSKIVIIAAEPHRAKKRAAGAGRYRSSEL